MAGWYFYDSGGVLRNVSDAYFYDSGGVLRNVTAGYFYDASGNLRKFYGQAGATAAFFPAIGGPLRTAASDYLWTVPTGVTAIHAACIAGGASGSLRQSTNRGSGGAGGALVYSNNIPVTPGEVLRIFPGAGAIGRTGTTAGAGTDGQATYLANSALAVLIQSNAPLRGVPAAGGTPTGGVINAGTGAIGDGGSGGTGSASSPGGGGGAGGYSGNGGNGGAGGANGATGAGGGGGGGAAGGTSSTVATRGGMGGGVGLFGVDAAGAGGTYSATSNDAACHGKSGSGGVDPPLTIGVNISNLAAGRYGGGGAGANMITGNTAYSGAGGPGGIMIRWGSGTEFPTLILPSQQSHDFTMTPVADGTYFTSCGPTVPFNSGGWGTAGSCPVAPPIVKQQAVITGIIFSSYDSTWQVYLGNVDGSPTDPTAYFASIVIDGLGTLPTSAATLPAMNASPGENYTYMTWPESQCPRWAAGVLRTLRVTY